MAVKTSVWTGKRILCRDAFTAFEWTQTRFCLVHKSVLEACCSRLADSGAEGLQQDMNSVALQ